MRAVHLATGAAVRCNRQGMRSNRAGVAVAVRITDDVGAVTCQDCLRLLTLDAQKARASAKDPAQ